MIIRNGVRHNTSNFGGSGNANIVKLTQSEYNALPESKNSDGILYAITDGECSASSGSSKPVELTKAEYEALGDKVNSDGILYAITDGDGLSAKSMAFDDTETQLGVNNVQDAIVEQNKNCNSFIKELCYNADTNYKVLENRVAVLDWIASNVTKNQCAIIATVRYANGYYYGYNFHTFNNNSFALEYNMHDKAVNVWYKLPDVDTWGIHNS